MRFVFNVSEVAYALQLDVIELRKLLPSLYDRGFPKPLKVLNEKWSILDVMNWVNQQNDEAETSVSETKANGRFVTN